MVRIFVNNARIPDRSACFQLLAEAQNKPHSEVTDLFDLRSGADWLVDAGILEPQIYIRHGDKIEKSCNADFEQEATRRYVNGPLMPHILGHVGYPDADRIPQLEAIGYNAGTIIGKGGIEASWNDTLAGRPGGKLSLVSASGARLRLLSEVGSKIPESIWLTIDAKLQENIVRVLDEAYRTSAWGRISYGAAVVVMDVNSGEILAMVSYPSFDGNALNPYPVVGRETANKVLEKLAEDERKPQINRATQGLYPTGSVMKGVKRSSRAGRAAFTTNRPTTTAQAVGPTASTRVTIGCRVGMAACRRRRASPTAAIPSFMKWASASTRKILICCPRSPRNSALAS